MRFLLFNTVEFSKRIYADLCVVAKTIPLEPSGLRALYISK